MFKTLMIAALASAALALPVMAQEGNGEPFPYRSSGLNTTVSVAQARFDVGSNAYPDVTGRPGSALNLFAGGLVPEVGSEASVQTANSLPDGAIVGLPVYVRLRPAVPSAYAGLARPRG